MGTSQHTTYTIPVETYLRGCVGYTVTDKALLSILFKRGVDSGELASNLTMKQLDLCTADLYMWCATLPSVSGSVEDADAGWKHKEGGSQISASDKSRLISMANDIYSKYGEATSKSNFRMTPRGMRVWRR